jgi:hypothetical protein
MDLHYVKSVLVSTGWTKTDDVFDPLEVWSARATPEDKPFNLEHAQNDIVGHITGTYVLDGDGKAVAVDTVAENLPASFNVVNEAVLYKHWADKDLQERMDKTLAEIAEGKWFVSMEVLFSSFDYSVGDKVVARSADTAFLSKHLRAYGGTGTYQGDPVGRVLRSLTFSGVALVKKPTNAASVILDDKAVASERGESTRAAIETYFLADKQEDTVSSPRFTDAQSAVASYFSKS